MSTFCCCLAITHTAEAHATEKCGVANRVLQPGISCLNPFVCERMVASFDLRAKLMTIVTEIKSQDDALANITTNLVTRVVDAQAMYYKLRSPQKQKKAFVRDALRAYCAMLSIDDVFTSKNAMADTMRRNLQEDVQPYGIKVIQLLITDIQVTRVLHNAMSRKEVAKRDKFTTSHLADANKIHIVKHAEAEADAEELAGRGIARARRNLIDGMRASIAEFHHENPDIQPQECYDTVLLVQYLQTLTQLEGGYGENLVLPFGPNAVDYLWNDLEEKRALTAGREFHIGPVDPRNFNELSEVHDELEDKGPLIEEIDYEDEQM